MRGARPFRMRCDALAERARDPRELLAPEIRHNGPAQPAQPMARLTAEAKNGTRHLLAPPQVPGGPSCPWRVLHSSLTKASDALLAD